MQDKKNIQVKQFVTFFIGNELFGINIKLINEVNPNVNIIPIPLSEPYIRGHVNIRGQVGLVLDLYMMFGKEKRLITDKSHIIIFKTEQDLLRAEIKDINIDFKIFGDKPVALLADDISDVLSVEPSLIETPTQNLKDIYSKFVTGVAKLEEKLLIIVDPVRILKYTHEENS